MTEIKELFDLDKTIAKELFEGKTYPIDADFRNVLRSQDILANEDFLPFIRVEKALRCFTGAPLPDDRKGLLDAIFRAVLRDEKESDGPASLSFSVDADRIIAAFWQAYGIDLTKERLHWWVFVALLANIPEDTRLMQVVNLRLRPVPAPNKHNKELRAALLRAKASVALRPTITPQQSADNLASTLIAIAEKMR